MENVSSFKLVSPTASNHSLYSFRNILSEINKRLVAGIDYQKILDFVFDSLDLVIPFDRIGIAIVNDIEAVPHISLKWMRSKLPAAHLFGSYSAPLKASSLEKIIETGEPRIIDDLIKYSAQHPQSESTKLILKDGIRSSLTCPLRSQNEQIGVIFFSSRKSNAYTEEHLKIFQEIAVELSLIFEFGRYRNDSELYTAQSRNLSMILHDLKSPLSVLQGFAEAAQDEDWFQSLDPSGKKIFSIFLRNTKNMFALLDGLSESSQLDQQIHPINLKENNLVDFCNEMANSGQNLASSKEINFSSKISIERTCVALFDAQKIRRVLDNLFSNAVKYSNRFSEIEFIVYSDSERINFEVLDHGLGIPKNEFNKLFHDFGKTSVRPTAGETSTGLGLAIAKKLVDEHGGSISLTSEVGKGSTFTFWIPLLCGKE
jgi:signal transduction histidine kinase